MTSFKLQKCHFNIIIIICIYYEKKEILVIVGRLTMHYCQYQRKQTENKSAAV